jgi:ATP synthase protein I
VPWLFFVPEESPLKMGNAPAFKRLRRGAYRLAGWQLVVTSLAAVAAGLVGGRSWLISAFTGGCIGVVAGLYQAQRMFRMDASEQPERYMGGVYVSEALKILLTVALFIAAIRVLRVELVPTMVGYAATFFVYWAALRTGFPGATERTDD